MEIVWEDPPENVNGRAGKTKVFVEALKEHPGNWAIHHTSEAPNASSVAAVYLKQRYGCEAISRNGVCYARWPEDVA